MWSQLKHQTSEKLNQRNYISSNSNGLSVHSQDSLREDTQNPSSLVSMKRPWTSSEDSLLCELVSVHGPKRWSLISYLFGARSGRQCRERWFNHLDPSVRKGAWSAQEDKIIQDLVKEKGHRWAFISKHLPGRTDNAVKNRFNSTIKKRMMMDGIEIKPSINRASSKGESDRTRSDLPNSKKVISPHAQKKKKREEEEESEEEEYDDEEEDFDDIRSETNSEEEEQDIDLNSEDLKPKAKRICLARTESFQQQEQQPKWSSKELLDPIRGLSLPETDENTSSLPSIMKMFL